MNRSRYWRLVAVSLLALTAFALRAVSLDAQSFWRDEVDALRFATAPWPEMLSNFTRPGWNGPLYFLLLRGWAALTGTSEFALRFFSLAFGVVGVPLAYALGRRLFDRWVGFFAALLMTFSPYLVWYAQEVKMYTLVTALALLAVYGLRRAMEEGGWRWWAVQVVATSMALYCHILAALLIPVQGLAVLAWWPRARRRWGGALISLACLTLPYLPLAVWQIPLLFQRRATGFYPYSLSEMAQILLNGWSAGTIGWGGPWGTVLMGALAVWGLVNPLISPLHPSLSPRSLRLRSGQVRGEGEGLGVRIGGLLAWLLFPLLAVGIVSLWQPLFTDRYLIWAAPAFYLLIALGLVSLWNVAAWSRWITILLIGAILTLDGVNLYRQATEPIKSDFRAAAAYVANYREPGDSLLVESRPAGGRYPFRCYLPLVADGHAPFDELIIFQIPYARYTFDYYFPVETYPWADGLYTNYRAPGGAYQVSETQVAQQMQDLVAGYDTVWLVATEAGMWDERGLVKAWLDTRLQQTDAAHFKHVDVYRYVRRGE